MIQSICIVAFQCNKNLSRRESSKSLASITVANSNVIIGTSYRGGRFVSGKFHHTVTS